MKHSTYTQMIHVQDTARQNAWAYIMQSWHTPTWRAIPDGIRNTLCLPATLGMYNGMLITKTGAEGVSLFVARMNSRRAH